MNFYPKPNITDAAAILLIVVALPLAAGLYGYFDGKRAGACLQILRWDKFKGQPLKGLTKRRQVEYEQCKGVK